MSSFVVVIPARFASERLPGKPLREIAGKVMLQHVFERGQESAADRVIIATDDKRIETAAKAFGADVVMTSADHQSGTDRLAEVCERMAWPDEMIIVNLQGDEPLMPPGLVNQCAALLDDGRADLATLASPLACDEDFRNPNVVKVVTDDDDFALYFSRAAIPFSRSKAVGDLALRSARHHHGIYAYRTKTLRRIVAAEPSSLERCEHLEQLRAMSLGMKIKVATPPTRPGLGIDTEDDLQKAQAFIQGIA